MLHGDWQMPIAVVTDEDIRRSGATTIPDAGEGFPGYSELNARIAWRVWEGVELSLVGQRLLHRRHTGLRAPSARGEIERSFYGKIAWEF
jgi:hypothetical protein